MKDYFVMFSRYNAWANGRLYDAAAPLSDGDFRVDRGTYFKSMLGTLNHLLVTDRIWMQRFTAQGEAPDTLDAILFDAFAPLRAAREAEDRRIVAYTEALDERTLASEIKYRRISGPEKYIQPLWSTLAHWFNHQTHHRAQAHATLTGVVGRAPELDLIYFQRLIRAPE